MGTRTCPTCRSSWSDPAAVWCGHCGALLTVDAPEPSADAGTPTGAERPPRLTPLRLVLVAGVVLIGVGSVALGSDTDGERPEAPGAGSEVDLPDAQEFDPVEARTSEPPPTLTCEPDGCLGWWTDRIDHRPAVVHRGMLFHVGREELLGLDVASGAVRWRQPHPPEWSWAVDRVEPIVDDHGVVLAHGSYIGLHDLATGELRAQATLDGSFLRHVERVPGGVLGVGRDGPIPPADDEVLLVDGSGEVVWRRTVTRWVGVVGTEVGNDPIDAVVLVEDGDQLLALRLADGTPQWWMDVEDAWVWLHGDRLVRFQPGGTQVEVLGNVAAAYPARPVVEHRWHFDDEVWWVDQVGALLAVAVGDDRHLVDPRDGHELATRRSVDDRAGAVGAALGDRTFVLWPEQPGEGSHDLEVYEPGVGLVSTIAVPRNPELTDLYGEVHPLGDGVVRVLLAGRQVTDVDVDAGEFTGLWFTVTEDIIDLSLHGDLVRVREHGETTILGPEGSISVYGASGIASSDPLIVHGGAGAMRLDRDLLTGR